MTAPLTSQTISSYQPPRMLKSIKYYFKILICLFNLGEKLKVKLQRIPPGTKWKQAKIDVIDSLFAFYVENLDPKVHDKFNRMLEELQ